MSKYSIIKLTNGQDIIGKILPSDPELDESAIKVDNPMAILTSVLDNGATVVFLRSYALMSKTKSVAVEKSHVITIYEPQKIMSDYYVTMIEYNKKFVEEDMIRGMKSAEMIIKDMIETGKINRKSKDPYEKSFEYWESMMKSDKKH
jgi:hypothetical protein